jgi:uncharacterized membrane protein
METIQRNDLNWFTVIIVALFCLLAGLGVGLVVKDIGHSHGQVMSALYGIVASIFFAVAVIIYMYASSKTKK